MKITLSPARRDDRLTLERIGDTLIVNGTRLDFTDLAEGATLPAGAVRSDWVAGPVHRTGGVLNLTLVLPHGANPPPETAFPAPIAVTGDGPVALPSYAPGEDDR